MEETAQKPACIFVGQMPSVTQDPLFQVIRVSAYLKHPDIMVCFQKKGIQILKIFDNILIIFTKIRRDPYGAVSTFHAVANRLCRIVGDAKRIDGQIFDMKSFILSNLMKDPLRKFSQGSALQPANNPKERYVCTSIRIVIQKQATLNGSCHTANPTCHEWPAR